MSARPEVSVVAATHDRAERLAALLESLSRQTLDPSRYEVIVVDDGSTDQTAGVLDGASLPAPLRVIARDDAGGPAVARNAGWRAARAPLVAFTDDDCEVEPQWLEALLEAARRAPAAFLQGETTPIERERHAMGPFARTLDVRSLGPWYQTCNIAYPRDLLERLGGFDEGFPSPGGEDTDLAWRAMRLGAKAMFVEDARAHHAVNVLGALGSLRLALRWSDTMRTVRLHPELRHWFTLRVFWKRSHARLSLALVGVLAARRLPIALLLALPYLREIRERAGGPRRAVALGPWLLLHDAVETYATVRGGIRHRTPVI